MIDTKKIANLFPSAPAGGVCISITLPLKKISQGRLENPVRLDAAFRKAKQLLKKNFPGQAAYLTERLKELLAEVDLKKPGAGAGIFLSPLVAKVVKFSYPVPERVLVEDSFEIRDLVNEFMLPHGYFALVLGKNHTRLYKETAGELKEVNDENFPMKFADNREYQKPGILAIRGQVRKSVSEDKRSTEKMRQVDWVKAVARLLKAYLAPGAPLFVIGQSEHVNALQNGQMKGIVVSGTAATAIGKLNREQVEAEVEEMMAIYLEEKAIAAAQHFSNNIAAGFAAFGIENSWDACNEGNCLALYVESTYEKAGYESPDGQQCSTRERKGWTKTEDLVDDLIEKALHQGAQIHFVPDGALKKFERVAAELRYQK